MGCGEGGGVIVGEDRDAGARLHSCTEGASDGEITICLPLSSNEEPSSSAAGQCEQHLSDQVQGSWDG